MCLLALLGEIGFHGFLSRLQLGHDLGDLGALDEAVEDDDQGLLVFVGELIDLLVEAVQLGVMDDGLAIGFRPSGQLVEGDIEDVGEPDNSAKQRRGVAVLPAGVNARADAEQFGQSGLGQLAGLAELSEPLVEILDVPTEREKVNGAYHQDLGETVMLECVYGVSISDLADGLTNMRYPSGHEFSFSYDTAGRISGVTDEDSTYASGISYHAHGAMKTLAFGNNIVETYGDNSRLQPASIVAQVVSTQADLWELSSFFCDGQSTTCSSNNGNVLSQSLSMPKTAGGLLALTQAYGTAGYDGVSRLTAAAESGEGTAWSQGFSYDRYGNRGMVAGSDMASPSLVPASFNAANNRIADAGYAFDTAGNLIAYGGRALAYDAENRQKTLTETDGTTVFHYSYDGEGRRVKKVAGGVTTIYVYDAFGSLAAEYSSSAPQHQAECETCYLTTDHLGSTRLVTDESGDVVRRYDYFPFGGEVSSGFGNRASVTGYESGSDWTNPKFTGKLRDYESGLNLDYFGARYYAGAMGRFTSADPLLGSANPLDPQTWNRYTYGLNNPLKYIDPLGLYVWDASLGRDATDEELREQLNKKAANKIIKRRDEIRQAIAKGAGSQDADVRGAYESYGAEYDDNGVTIANQKPKSGGVGAAGQQLEYVDGGFRSQATVSVDPKQKGNNLFITLAHEGSHVRDGQAYAAAATRLGDVPGLAAVNLTILQTETNAYTTSVNAARMLALPNLSYSTGGRSYQIWRGGTAAVDRPVLQQYLRASPLYNKKLNNLMFPR